MIHPLPQVVLTVSKSDSLTFEAKPQGIVIALGSGQYGTWSNHGSRNRYYQKYEFICTWFSGHPVIVNIQNTPMVNRYFVYKQALLKEAEQLVQANVIHEKEDIYYLSFEELREVVRTHKLDDQIISKQRRITGYMKD